MRTRRGPLSVLALTLALPAPAGADHSVGTAPSGGTSVDWVLLAGLVVGFVLVIALAAWATLAPEREDRSREDGELKERPR